MGNRTTNSKGPQGVETTLRQHWLAVLGGVVLCGCTARVALGGPIDTDASVPVEASPPATPVHVVEQDTKPDDAGVQVDATDAAYTDAPAATDANGSFVVRCAGETLACPGWKYSDAAAMIAWDWYGQVDSGQQIIGCSTGPCVTGSACRVWMKPDYHQVTGTCQ